MSTPVISPDQAIAFFEETLIEHLESLAPEERSHLLSWLELHASDTDVLPELIQYDPQFALRFSTAIETRLA
jgi:hypothetical protein